MRRRLTIIAGLVGSCLLLWSASPLLSSAQQPSAEELAKRIDKTRGKVEFRKGKERVLTRDIERYSRRIDGLQSRIDRLSARENQISGDLSAQRAVLDETQRDLRAERARLVRLQQRLREVRGVLSARLVQLYKQGRPDLATVILEADGFSQLIERGEYVSRLAQKDREIVGIVSRAREDATSTERRLARLERRQRAATAAITARRNEVVRVRSAVASTQSSLREARNGRRGLLDSVKSSRKELEEDLAAMQAQQARISGALNTSIAAGPIRNGTGRFVYPMNGTFTSPFGMRWGRLHAGIDIAAPIGTPIRAADGGRVAIAGSVSGYGNYTCIQHGGGLSTCYAHQSSMGVSVGQQVTKGQVIGLCGNTGRSTGPHLHFEVRVNGNPVNPMNYL